MAVILLITGLAVFGPASPAWSVGTYDIAAIADKALSYLNQDGTVACADAGKPGGDQCKQFVNCIVYMVSGHTQYPVDPNGNYQNSYRHVGGTEVSSADAVKGDIIQYGSVDGDAAAGKLHTAIVVENKGGGAFSVVDANFKYDGKVGQHDYSPPSGSRFWRMGTAAGSNGGSSGSNGVPPDGMIIESEDSAHWYVAFAGSLIWFDSSVAWVREALLRERDRRFGWMNAPKMTYDQIHAIEYGYGGNRSHVPADNAFFYEAGSLQQYVIQYRYAFSVANAEEVAHLGGVSGAVMVPPGLASRLAGVPDIPNDAILKAAGNNTYHHVVHGQLYWANNFTVIGCIQTVKSGRLQPVPASMIQLFQSAGRVTGQPTHCSFPSSWALYGPGGAERWRIDGNNPYVRHRYADALSLHCWLGSSPAQVQLPDARGINEPTEAEPLGCPNNSFVRIIGNGQVFRVDNGVMRYISSPSMLSCLTWGNDGVVVNVDGAVVANTPRGSPLQCEFEGRLLHSPDGRVDYVSGGQRYHVPTTAVANCLKARRGSGNPVNVSHDTAASYADSGAKAYCPYETTAGANFVREDGDPTVWLVGPPQAPGQPGVKRHAGSLCVPDPYTTSLGQYRVYVVPPGETAGHVRGPDFAATPASCQALPQG